jgi:[acyl-carrier-protein] S-malonyltransferase
MAAIGLLFPGQGTQSVGMGRWLAQRHPAAAEVFARADELLGFSISDLCFRGPAPALTATENAQPAVLVVALATHAALEAEGTTQPAVVAGHSIGELGAAVVAGVLGFDDAIRAVRRRGELMAAIESDGAMASVLGLTQEQLDDVCRAASGEGDVVVGLVNGPDNCVLSGHRTAVERATEEARAAGATRVTPLATSHAFHSPLMTPALRSWTEVVEALDLRAPALPLVLNVSGAVAESADDVRSSLVRQLTAPVRWDLVSATVAERADVVVEVGASKAVSALTRRCRPDLPVRTTHEPRALQRVVDESAGVSA